MASPLCFEDIELSPMHNESTSLENDQLLILPAERISTQSTQGPSNSINYTDKSLLLIALITFVGDSSRGLLFSVLWPLCQVLGGSVIDVGYLVAMFSIGRLIATTPLGYFCDRYRHKLSLLIANVVLIMGALLWANAYSTRNIVALYTAQFIMGVGSGSLGVTRSFAVEQVEPSQRTKTVALLTALQYAGFTVSPFIGSFISALGDGTNYWTYALPAYMIAYLAFLCVLGLLFQFEDVNRELPQKNKKPPTSALDATSDMKSMILLFVLLNIGTKGSIAVYETLGSQIGLVDYNLSSIQLGTLISVAGAVGFIQLLLFESFWCKFFSDLQLMLGGLLVMMGAQVFIINYGSTPDLGTYIVAIILMYAAGYPIAHTAVLGGFAKLQKSGPQAAMMGWFASAGSLARIILPLISGYLDTVIDNGPFSIVLAMLALSYFGIMLYENKIRYYIDDHSIAFEDKRYEPLSRQQKIQAAIMILVFCFGLVSLSFSTNVGPEFEVNEPWEAQDV